MTRTDEVQRAIESFDHAVYPAEIARVVNLPAKRVMDIAAALYRDGRVAKVVRKRGQVPGYIARDLAHKLPPSLVPHLLDLKPCRNAELEQLAAKLRRQGPTKINLERIRRGRSVFDWCSAV